MESQNLFLIALLLVASVPNAQARSLRFLDRSLRVDANVTVHATDEPPPGIELPEGAIFQVVSKTSPKQEESAECLCPVGQFWHGRLRECAEQGAWGYECGFFPQEHWHRVCQDQLKCQALGTQDHYHSHGKFKGTANSAPASCIRCSAADNCKVGMDRQKEECMIEHKLVGEACATVRITLPAREVEVNEEIAHTATVKAFAEATAEAEAKVKLPGGTETSDKAEATKATATATETFEAEASHTAKETISSVKSTEQVVGEASECVSVQTGKEILGVDGIKGVSSVLSAEIVTVMEEEALARATRSALELAIKKGLLSEEDAASIAKQEAEARLKIEAEGTASAKAAEAAEAGAKAKAQASAEAAASEMAKANAKAAADASAAADAAAKAAADASAADAAAKAAKTEADAAAAAGAAKGEEEKPAEPAEEKPAEEKPAAEKPAEEAAEPAEQKPVEEKPVEEKPAVPPAGPSDSEAQAAVGDIASGGLNGEPLTQRVEPREPPVQRKVPEGHGMP